MKTSRQISFPASQYLPGGFKIRLTCLPCLKAVPLSFSRLRNIETLSNLFRSVLLLSPGKWCFIAPIMHADVATQAAGCQPLYQGDDDEARLHIKVGGWVSWCVRANTCGTPMMCVCIGLSIFCLCVCVCVFGGVLLCLYVHVCVSVSLHVFGRVSPPVLGFVCVFDLLFVDLYFCDCDFLLVCVTVDVFCVSKMCVFCFQTTCCAVCTCVWTSWVLHTWGWSLALERRCWWKLLLKQPVKDLHTNIEPFCCTQTLVHSQPNGWCHPSPLINGRGGCYLPSGSCFQGDSWTKSRQRLRRKEIWALWPRVPVATSEWCFSRPV